MQYLFKQAHRIHKPPLMQYQSIRFNLQAKNKEKKEDAEFGVIADIQDQLAGFQDMHIESRAALIRCMYMYAQ